MVKRHSLFICLYHIKYESVFLKKKKKNHWDTFTIFFIISLHHKWPGCWVHSKHGDQTDHWESWYVDRDLQQGHQFMKQEQGYLGATSQSDYWH